MKAIVLLSGGQDSTTSLAWACKMWAPDQILALSIYYGQRHMTELVAAQMVAGMAGVKHEELHIAEFGKALSKASALTGSGDVAAPSNALPGVPASFVPGRNAFFLTVAAGVAVREGAHDIVTGVCQTDYSGYPDCRLEFIQSMQQSLRLALGGYPLFIQTPLMHMTKAETVQMMDRLGSLWWLKWSHTCYEGKKPPCQNCPACVLRAKGFAEANIKDPLLENAPIVPAPPDMPF